MRQVWIARRGGPEVLEVREAPDPTPGKGEVRVRVHAAGVNFADTLARSGLYPDAPPLPAVVGYEVAGIIDAAGEGAPQRVGERVLGLTRFGGYSDVVCVPSARALRLPERLSFAQGAALPVQWLTAWHLLMELGNLRPGHTVLVHSAGGGVGTAVLAICKRVGGVKVIGTASPGKHARLRELGLDHAIGYEMFDEQARALTAGRGVDLALDAVGGDSFKRSYRALAPAGRLVMFGVSAMAGARSRNVLKALSAVARLPVFLPIPMLQANKGVFGVNMGRLWNEEALLARELAEVLRGVEEGAFTPIVDLEVPFAEARRAHERLQQRENFGKVVLVP